MLASILLPDEWQLRINGIGKAECSASVFVDCEEEEGAIVLSFSSISLTERRCTMMLRIIT